MVQMRNDKAKYKNYFPELREQEEIQGRGKETVENGISKGLRKELEKGYTRVDGGSKR